MQKFGLVLGLLIALEMLVGQALAESSDDALETLSRLAHENMAGASVDGVTEIGPERAATLEYPLIDEAWRQYIIHTGFRSGVAAACGLDWRSRNFKPLMAELRAQEDRLDNYQLAYAGLLHGVAMGVAERSYHSKTCSNDNRDRVSRQLLVR